jgi:hypothetical protein
MQLEALEDNNFPEENSLARRPGYSSMGSLNGRYLYNQEAFYLTTKFHLFPKYPIWFTFWKSHIFPKVSTFIWLLAKNKILTWHNIRKKGFVGTSMCPLCL